MLSNIFFKKLVFYTIQYVGVLVAILPIAIVSAVLSFFLTLYKFPKTVFDKKYEDLI